MTAETPHTILDALHRAAAERRDVVVALESGELLRGLVASVNAADVVITPSGLKPERIDLRQVVRVNVLGIATAAPRRDRRGAQR